MHLALHWTRKQTLQMMNDLIRFYHIRDIPQSVLKRETSHLCYPIKCPHKINITFVISYKVSSREKHHIRDIPQSVLTR